MTILLDDVSVDGSSADFKGSGSRAVVHVRADNFGTATVSIQSRTSNDSLNRYATLVNGSFTTNGTVELDSLPLGMIIRANVSGSTGAESNIFVDILE